MRSALKSLSILATGLMFLAVTGCSSGDSDKTPPDPGPTPGPVDTTPREPEPGIRFLYFVADVYRLEDPAQPHRTHVYQYNVSSPRAENIDRGSPIELLRPPVALAAGRINHAFAVMREGNRFLYLAPDVEIPSPLTKFKQTICDLPTNSPSRSTGTYLTGVGRDQVGLYVRSPGEDGRCHSADDQFWAIPLTAQATVEATPVPKAMALGQPLLDQDFTLHGYIYAAPGEPVQTLDSTGEVVQEQVIQAGGGTLADGPVVLHQAYDADHSVLVIGTKIYLVETARISEPDFTLPPPVLTLSAPEMAASIRFDGEGFYVIDGLRLKAVDYASRQVSELLDAASENLTGISFGNFVRGHSQIFTAHHVLVLGESDGGKQLLAINKASAGSGVSLVADQVADEYLATENYLYFSKTTSAGEGEIAQALVYQDINGTLEPTTYGHDDARWHFYRRDNGFRAFLIQSDAKEYSDGFFTKPRFYVYRTNQPEVPADRLPLINKNVGFRIVELGYGDGGHLLMTLENNDTRRGRDIYYLGPLGRHSQITVVNELGANTVICPRIDFDRPSSFCGSLE